MLQKTFSTNCLSPGARLPNGLVAVDQDRAPQGWGAAALSTAPGAVQALTTVSWLPPAPERGLALITTAYGVRCWGRKGEDGMKAQKQGPTVSTSGPARARKTTARKLLH
ncbi:hypothetical protein SKAU_G00295800 [Synaphobranchus kaupii]|uniref:Uncharacterized protein n=1 Tax=Synaphobranchus kaupii TaxID=118154 RepID=A0A9Q1ILT8_SYNKA|nr:hypothetical protein SKAU_G00295800 [Synaphobranchus kaupii]